jgi:hypothetical protein
VFVATATACYLLKSPGLVYSTRRALRDGPLRTVLRDSITSVNGSVVIAPLQVPVSAGICFDAIIMTTIVRHKITAERSFSFIEGFLRFVLRIVKSAEPLNLRTY